MATCEDCHREMILAASCIANALDLAGERFWRIRYRAPRELNDPTIRCHDCGVRPGGYHHAGCDMELCPRCRGQLLSCGCWDDEDEEDDDSLGRDVEGLEPPSSAW
jgi:hypothetical protein